MIKKIVIKNFKCFRDFILKDIDQMNIVVGGNNLRLE